MGNDSNGTDDSVYLQEVDKKADVLYYQVANKPNRQVIQFLEDALAMAKNGDIHALAMVALHAGNTTSSGNAGVTLSKKTAINGALVNAIFQLNQL